MMTLPMEFQNLLLARDEGVATVTINRPGARNALNTPTINEGALTP